MGRGGFGWDAEDSGGTRGIRVGPGLARGWGAGGCGLDDDVLPLYFGVKDFGEQGPIVNLHEDGNVGILERSPQGAERSPDGPEGRSADDEVEIAGIVALTVYAAAIRPNLTVRHMLPEKLVDCGAPVRP